MRPSGERGVVGSHGEILTLEVPDSGCDIKGITMSRVLAQYKNGDDMTEWLCGGWFSSST